MTWTESDLWLEPMPAALRRAAVLDFNAGNVEGFLCKASNDYGLELVVGNIHALKRAGLYESALLKAFTGTRINNSNWPVGDLRWLFEQADRAQLRAAGDPLPPGEQFTLYRGVAGRGPARRVRGLSWTSSLETAAWFACRHPLLEEPAVYRAIAGRTYIYAYMNGRDEEEFVVLLPTHARVTRLYADLPSLASQYSARIKRRFDLAKHSHEHEAT